MKDLVTSAQVKSLSREDLEFIFQDKFKFKTKPLTHQLASMLWAYDRDHPYFLHGIGTGKTLVAIYTSLMWNCDRVLVVCPNAVKKTWEDEVRKHTDLCCALLEGESKKRRAIMENDFSKFHVVNYEGLKSLFGTKIDVKKKGVVTGGKYIPDEEAIHKFQYDCIVFDEAHRLKEITCLQSQISYKLARNARKIIMLTGTPISKDIRDMWSELFILDNGETFGNSQFEFLHTYMNRVEIKTKRGVFYEWFPKKGVTEQLVQKLYGVALRYDSSECIDLPPLVEEKRHVDMSDEQKRITRSIIDELRIDLDSGLLSLKNIENKASKLAQIGSGFVLNEGKVEYLKSNPKLDELVDLLDEIEGKVIVFHNFVATGHAIEERLKKEKIFFRSIRGEINDKSKQITEFIEKPDVKVLVAHPLSGGEGLNLQCASVVIFFEQIYSGATLREQCIGRVRRNGQKADHCVIIDLLIHNDNGEESIDDKIFEVAKNKKELAKAILEWIQKSK